MEIRKLTAQEIECRVSRINRYDKSSQIVLLLYKDARVDQRLLDEIFGSMNWKREHQVIGDRLYCTVSVWDADKGQWISKQDVGTESNAEPEKAKHPTLSRELVSTSALAESCTPRQESLSICQTSR